MKKHIILLLSLALVFTACSTLCSQKSRLANTRWTCSVEEFVADVGTATTTYTLEFTSAKTFALESEHVLPAHPATYVNADGTIDRIPGATSQYVRRGTYKAKKGTVVLSEEDGTVYTLRLVQDRLESDDLSYSPLVFTRDTASE